ncbi:hypothetical protein WN59_06745 [Salinicoccus sediminis]|uniref:Uncharacterized protein n=1 Tax=Salinicoccus sediminis TaxID=1432562 RepID=A0A0M2SM33_9STAP|nr:hypothetical protein [Salinicoccus sediminis]KKK34721.1 hypothetical protein WN59_06745 [Salinicoccus sediminis]
MRTPEETYKELVDLFKKCKEGNINGDTDTHVVNKLHESKIFRDLRFLMMTEDISLSEDDFIYFETEQALIVTKSHITYLSYKDSQLYTQKSKQALTDYTLVYSDGIVDDLNLTEIHFSIADNTIKLTYDNAYSKNNFNNLKDKISNLL